MQLTGAGFSKTEISEICDSSDLHRQEILTDNIVESGHKDTSPARAIPDNGSNTDTDAASDLEGNANKLYVKASNQVQSIKKGAGSYTIAFELYQSALSKIERITSDYDISNIAVALISDQMKIVGLTLSELEKMEDTLRTLAEAEQDPLACALLLAGTINEADSKVRALTEVAGQYAVHGQHEKTMEILSLAIQTAKTIEFTLPKAELLTTLAGIYATVGQKENAAEVLSLALEFVGSVTADYSGEKSGALMSISSEYAEIGYLPRAYETITTIVRNEYKAEAIFNIVDKYIKAGNITQALETVGTIKHAHFHSKALSIIAKKYAEKEQFSKALVMAKSINNVFYKSDVLSTIASKYAEAGQQQMASSLLSEAHETAEGIAHVISKIEVYVKIAEAYAVLSQQKEAVLILYEALDMARISKSSKTEKLSEVAGMFAKIGQFTVAIEVAEQAEDAYQKAMILAEVSEKYAETGQSEMAVNVLHQALESAEEIEYAFFNANALSIIAVNYAGVGQFVEAIKVVETINDTGGRARALVNIAGKFADVGHQPGKKEKLIFQNMVQAVKPITLYHWN